MILPVDVPRDLPKNQTVEFYDTDSQDLYEKNFEKYNDQWIWRQRKFDYTLNSLGYRMKEFNQINWSNYMAVFGCSFTVGVGLPLEETFAYKISKAQKLDLVNAAVAGGNNDLVLINLCRLLSNDLPPRLVIINWPTIFRKTYWVNGRPTLYLTQIICDSSRRWIKSFDNRIENFDQLIYEFQEIKQQVDLLCKLAMVPVWHITNYSDYDSDPTVQKIIYDLDCVRYSIEEKNQYLGRDIEIYDRHAHPGINLQDKICKYWEQYKHKLGFQ